MYTSKEREGSTMINNMPAYAANYRFIVYRVVAGEKWFYGAYNDLQWAKEVAAMIEGFVA
jgi:hypothetical protein